MIISHCVLEQLHNKLRQRTKSCWTSSERNSNLYWCCEYLESMTSHKLPRPTAQIHNRSGVGVCADPVLTRELLHDEQVAQDGAKHLKTHGHFNFYSGKCNLFFWEWVLDVTISFEAVLKTEVVQYDTVAHFSTALFWHCIAQRNTYSSEGS